MKKARETIYQYETSSLDKYGMLKVLARQNRRHPTHAEQLLWNALRRNRYKLSFRRQHPVGDYIADFACLSHKLIIEVDGDYHATESQIAEDGFRTEKLNELGFTVIRFTNSMVEADPARVAEQIYDQVFSME